MILHESALLARISELEALNLALSVENKHLREALGLPLDLPLDLPLPDIGLNKPEVEFKGIKEKPVLEHRGCNENIAATINQKNAVAINQNNATNINPKSAVTITKNSPPAEKIALFMSLFRGRTDVYAKRCYSKKHGSGYYIPACKNEWVRDVCDRMRMKCKDCAKRELLPLTEAVINSHLRNQDANGAGIAGIYPLLTDETCLFLAIDFDGENWQKDMAVFRSVCERLGIPVAVERSRSGNGAHAWLFFEEPVPAVSVRKLGNVLLTKAMSVRHEIGFASYDRMFPNQDCMPKGGFGNLIALPLQGGARKKGNSEFIDENFQSYPDQWAYLAAIRKITTQTLNAWLAQLCTDNGLGELASAEINDDDRPKPWESKKPELKFDSTDFPEKLVIVEANMLYIPKKEVSQCALNRIKRLAAFSNPQFYKTQKMRMSTFGIPRIIYSLDETAEYMGIPRGCRSSLTQLLDDSNVNYQFENKRNKGKDIKVDFRSALYDEQQTAADALLKH